MFRIGINDGARVVESRGGTSLLVALAEGGVWLPSICGGATSCGECACAARGEFAEPSSVELAVLGEERRARGMRLACCLIVASDIELELPDAVLAVRKRRARVVEAREIARETRSITFEFDGDPLPFRPGQYLRVIVPPHEGLGEAVQRAYSFASRPGTNRVSIVVRRAKSGLASVWLHDVLAEGDELDMVGPFGSFEAPRGDGPLLCVAGGTGLAPFFPILAAMEESGEFEKRDVILVVGVREPADLFRAEELQALAGRVRRFRFVPVAQEADEAWTGWRGRVTDAIETILSADSRAWSAALCGSPGMVQACERLLARHGISGEAVSHDSFS